ncbi:NAD-dependent succinate-semialdehyde dehydrogenase [Verrucosispora sp. WMMD573]|uniref:NAD-dependent succinate-semialdehyde dehydrogenase n=1 Tax=Verrucosispora sp. WMMD573 TaxID=3015149 RepID=UPI00248AE723|nr:NAD-dependent succinate-semialdehyde dehydrogenase [Verrucosispora sp. WMMD573]WBB54440.1 NAD-dependent succinate-semialdehyde dehydrogenase [Verrucosispora sp. WMMD573]
MSTSTLTTELLDRLPGQLLIGGQWRDGSGGIFDVVDPATGQPLRSVADATAADALDALDAAAAAQSSWAATPARQRAEILRRAYELMRDRAEQLALLATLEMGKPLVESRAEVAYAAEFFRWFSEEASRIEGDFRRTPEGTHRILVMRQPVGPSLLITPWNFPLAMPTRKIAPALAAGCTTVLKPAEETPLCALAIAEILVEAGLPPGVLNVVTAADPAPVSAALMNDARLRKVSFTGSTPVGSHLLRTAADRVLRVSLELGGNAPFIVFDDADLDDAVAGAMAAKMRNIGEACTAANRFFVAEPVAEEFVRRLAQRMSELAIGPGIDPRSQVGPLINAVGRDKVAGLVDDALARGATPVLEGGPMPGAGFFFAPTVLTGISPDSRLLTEEIFGPVAPVLTFRDEDEVIAAANDTDFGLLAYVYTADLRRSLRVAERLEVGMVGLNQGVVSNAAAPFGGIKLSGLGREGGRDGIEEYLETKYVGMAE